MKSTKIGNLRLTLGYSLVQEKAQKKKMLSSSNIHKCLRLSPTSVFSHDQPTQAGSHFLRFQIQPFHGKGFSGALLQRKERRKPRSTFSFFAFLQRLSVLDAAHLFIYNTQRLHFDYKVKKVSALSLLPQT